MVHNAGTNEAPDVCAHNACWNTYVNPDQGAHAVTFEAPDVCAHHACSIGVADDFVADGSHMVNLPPPCQVEKMIGVTLLLSDTHPYLLLPHSPVHYAARIT